MGGYGPSGQPRPGFPPTSPWLVAPLLSIPGNVTPLPNSTVRRPAQLLQSSHLTLLCVSLPVALDPGAPALEAAQNIGDEDYAYTGHLLFSRTKSLLVFGTHVLMTEITVSHHLVTPGAGTIYQEPLRT